MQSNKIHTDKLHATLQKINDYLRKNITKADLLQELLAWNFRKTQKSLMRLGAGLLEGIIETLATDLRKSSFALQTAFEMLTGLEIIIVTRNNVKEFDVVQETQRATAPVIISRLRRLQMNFPLSFQMLGDTITLPLRRFFMTEFKYRHVTALYDAGQHLELIQQNLMQYGNSIQMDGDFYRWAK